GGGTDKAILGTDYMVTFSKVSTSPNATITRYIGSGGFNAIGTAPASVFSNRLETTLPLSLLQSDGNINFKVIAFSELGNNSNTAVLDYASTPGLQPGHVQPPVLRFSPTTLSSASPGSAYTATLTPTGGTGAGYSWTATGLPTWLTLSSGGSL